MPDGDEPIEVIVALDDGAPLPTVVAALERAGLTRAQPLDELHVVTGSVDPDRIAALEAVPGVKAVEPARRVTLPPRDAPQ